MITIATSCSPHTVWSCDTGHAAVLVRWYGQTTDVMAPRGLASLAEGPRRLPAGPHAFLSVVLGPVGQRMALSVQPKEFTPALHDVRPEPVAALVGAGAEDGRAIASDRAPV